MQTVLEQGSIDKPLTFDVGLIQLSFIPVCSLNTCNISVKLCRGFALQCFSLYQYKQRRVYCKWEIFAGIIIMRLGGLLFAKLNFNLLAVVISCILYTVNLLAVISCILYTVNLLAVVISCILYTVNLLAVVISCILYTVNLLAVVISCILYTVNLLAVVISCILYTVNLLAVVISCILYTVNLLAVVISCILYTVHTGRPQLHNIIP